MDRLTGEFLVGMTVESALGGVVYRWAMLPKTPGLVAFFGILSLGPLAIGIVLAVGVAVALIDGDVGSAIPFGLGSVVFAIVGMYFLQFLVGRCRLILSREKLQYEEFFLGFRNRRQCRELAAADVLGLHIGDTERGGIEVRTRRGDPFFLRVPVGTGAFSMADLMGLKQQWVRDLALESETRAGPGADEQPAAG